MWTHSISINSNSRMHETNEKTLFPLASQEKIKIEIKVVLEVEIKEEIEIKVVLEVEIKEEIEIKVVLEVEIEVEMP